MAREIFKNLPDTSTPINATKLNGVFNGEESMGSIVVEDVSCKNIFDKNIEIKLNSNLDADGTISDNTGLFVQLYYISVKPNTTYTISTKNGNYKRIGQYDNSKTFISRLVSGASDTQYTFTTASNCYYIRVACSITDLDSIQIEKGSVATDYVEYDSYSNNEAKEYADSLDAMNLKCVYKRTNWNNKVITSTVNVNAGDGGALYLISYSGHNSTGNYTNGYLGLLRCGYNGNNYAVIEIVKNSGSGGIDISFSVDTNGYLTHQNGASNGATKLAIYKLT